MKVVQVCCLSSWQACCTYCPVFLLFRGVTETLPVWPWLLLGGQGQGVTPMRFPSRFSSVGAQAEYVHLFVPNLQGPTAKCFQCQGSPGAATLVALAQEDRQDQVCWMSLVVRPTDGMEKSGKLLSTAAQCLKHSWLQEQLFQLQLN